MFGHSITKDFLRDLACAASTDFLQCNTPLTEAVVKVASHCGQDLTAEHVRRICEMTYHDVYERMHKTASSGDRYISFDPPDANTAIGMLRAKRVDSQQKVASAAGGLGMIDKTASAPRRRTKFQAANAFSELMKTASTPTPEIDRRQLRKIDNDLKEAIASVRTEYSGAQVAADVEMGHLIKEAYQSYKDGYSIEEILHACYSGSDSEAPRHISVKVASALAENLANRVPKTAGLGINKTASLGEVTPDHPLPAKFKSAVKLANERAHLELTLEDLKHDRDYFRKQVESLYAS